MKNVNFESAISELESIVRKLEGGSVGLEESIALYEKGVSLSNACSDMLENTKLKIEVIKNSNYTENESDLQSEVEEWVLKQHTRKK